MPVLSSLCFRSSGEGPGSIHPSTAQPPSRHRLSTVFWQVCARGRSWASGSPGGFAGGGKRGAPGYRAEFRRLRCRWRYSRMPPGSGRCWRCCWSLAGTPWQQCAKLALALVINARKALDQQKGWDGTTLGCPARQGRCERTRRQRPRRWRSEARRRSRQLTGVQRWDHGQGSGAQSAGCGADSGCVADHQAGPGHRRYVT